MWFAATVESFIDVEESFVILPFFGRLSWNLSKAASMKQKFCNLMSAVKVSLWKWALNVWVHWNIKLFVLTFQSIGYRSGDVVALFMENSADMVTAWVGLSKIGVITAWINNNLRLEPLAHCMNTSKARSVICSKNLCSGSLFLFQFIFIKLAHAKSK